MELLLPAQEVIATTMLRTATSSRECLICFSPAPVRSNSLACLTIVLFMLSFPACQYWPDCVGTELTRVVEPLPRQLCLCLRPRGRNKTGEKNQHQNTDAFHSCPQGNFGWFVPFASGGAAYRGGSCSSEFGHSRTFRRLAGSCR